MSKEFVQKESNYLAGLLDAGRSDQVRQRLHDDLQNLAPGEFNAVIRQTAQKEHKGMGDDLYIQHDGSIVINHTTSTLVGNLYPETQALVNPPQPNRGAVEQPCDTTQQTIQGGTIGAVLGSLGGILVRGNNRGAGPGAVLGALSGAAIGHANAKEDCGR